MPKSSTFGAARPASTKMLSGLRSRWTMPCACAAPSASSTWRIEPRDAAERQRRRAVRVLDDRASGAPSRYSITMYGRPSGSVDEIEHVDDALVTDQVDRARLGEEPLDRVAALAALARQHLDRDAAADRRVHALVDAAHAADAEQARDPVRADRRAEQHVLADR